MKDRSGERIAVTGVGMVCALGRGSDAVFRRLVEGQRGFRPVTLFDTAGQRAHLAAEVSELDVGAIAPPGEEDRWSRSDAMAWLAAEEALRSGELPDAAGAPALAVGATTGGMYEAEAVLASLPPSSADAVRRLLSYPLSATAERLRERLGAFSREATLCSACSSGANAVLQGVAWIRSGKVDRVLAGGTDGLCRLTFTGFNALGAVDPEPCRPFDRTRAGTNLGEGAAFLLLEPESLALRRGATVLAWLTGWAVGAEAHHITHPEPSGVVAARLMSAALERAGLGPADVDYINAHGTATIPNDAAEALAIRTALGAEACRVFVSSSKGQLGHTLGAAGALEAAVTVLAVHRQQVPPTMGLADPEDEGALRHVIGKGHPAELRAAVTNSFGFGGTGCVLAFERVSGSRGGGGIPVAPGTSADLRAAKDARDGLVITGCAALGPLGLLTGADCRLYAVGAGGPAPESPDVPDPLALLDPARSRRFDRAAALVTAGATAALGCAGISASGAGLVAGTAYGSVERSVAFLKRVAERGPGRAPPAEFPHLVPSAASGNASIYTGLTGPVLAVSDLGVSAEAAFTIACDLVELQLAPAMVAGSAEPRDSVAAAVLGPLRGGRPGKSRGEGSAWVVVEPRRLATQRGARLLAEVRGWGEVCRGGATVDAPAPRAAAVVVIGAGSTFLDGALSRTGWARVEKRRVADRAGEHEGVGGFALSAAAALVAAGEVKEALVCGSLSSRMFWVHLGAPS